MIGSGSLRVLAGFSALLVMTAGTAEADMAPQEPKNPTRPVAIYGPKSHPVPERAIGGIRVEEADDSGYLYAGASQRVNNDGTWADITVAKPYVAPADDHTLAEIAVESTDEQQIVEVGWIVGSGDPEPRLFVYHWVNNQETCYNGCGYVQTSTRYAPGQKLPLGVQEFRIQHFSGRWNLGYGGEWFGYFPDSLWGGRYTSSGVVQWFGEVSAASTTRTCTDMGNGQSASSNSAASFKIGFFNGTNVRTDTYATNSSFYSIRNQDSQTLRFGGGGAC